jgi:hypothetical protein
MNEKAINGRLFNRVSAWLLTGLTAVIAIF